MADPGKYRAAAEVELWKERDPLPGFGKRLLAEGIAVQAQLDAILEKARGEVQEAVKFAEESPWPEDSEVFSDIFV
jgi:pyruvate dehydrogenase E1 component alpha subunit